MGKLRDKLILDFESGRIKKTDLIVIRAHSTIGLLIWCTYQQDLMEKETLKDFASGYVFALPLLLVGLFFRKLGNIKFYLVWLNISIIQVFIYPLVKDNPDFAFPRGTAFDGLVALLPNTQGSIVKYGQLSDSEKTHGLFIFSASFTAEIFKHSIGLSDRETERVVNAVFEIPKVISLATLLDPDSYRDGRDDLGPSNQSPGDDAMKKRRKKKKRRGLRL